MSHIQARKILKNKNGKAYNRTWVIILGSMSRGNRSTANSESDVNALDGVKSPPKAVNNPKAVTVTKTGMLFSMKLFNCKIK